jgi:flagellar export protein FliJ
MGFQFSLETVLQFRENAEKQEEVKLQQVMAELIKVQDEVERLSAQMRETASKRAEILVQSASAFYLHAIESEMEQARRRQSELKLHIHALEEKKAEQLHTYRQKRTARSILDEMQKKQRQAFDKEQSVQDQKRLDDLFGARLQRE